MFKAGKHLRVAWIEGQGEGNTRVQRGAASDVVRGGNKQDRRRARLPIYVYSYIYIACIPPQYRVHVYLDVRMDVRVVVPGEKGMDGRKYGWSFRLKLLPASLDYSSWKFPA